MHSKFHFTSRITNVMAKHKVRVKENIICHPFLC